MSGAPLVVPVTRHLWHVIAFGETIGAILRVNGERDTVYQAQPAGRPRERWETCATFEDAQTVLLAVAAGCIAPDACSCSYCRSVDAPEVQLHQADAPAAAPAAEAKPEAQGSRFAWLEVD